MMHQQRLSFLLVTLLVVSPGTVPAQIDPGEMPVQIFEALDPAGTRFGAVVVVGRESRGYETGYEYWRFSDRALLEMAELDSLELAAWAAGAWDDPWVVEALGWQPEGASVEWSHPAAVEWTPQDESLPPVVPGGTYFGHPTLGGLTIQYSPGGSSSLTWFKLTEGAFMQLEDGAVFERQGEAPTTGSWWHGSIEPGS